jgi:hypothetical protein
MWVKPDVCGLFSMSVGSFSGNMGLSALIFSDNVGRKLRCFRAEPFIFSGHYNYVEQGRFSEYRQRVIQLIQGAHPYSSEHMMACMESMEFGDVLQHVRAYDRQSLQRTLKAVLNGPVLQYDEDMNSNESRNRLFELTMASKLSRAHLNPSLSEPDLMCDVDGKRLFIACKRPLSPMKVNARIREAERQVLQVIKDAPPGARGVVAISMSKVMNRGDQLFVYSGERQGRNDLADRLEAMSDCSEEVWKTLGDGIVGIIFHIITAGVDEAASIYVRPRGSEGRNFGQVASMI